MTNKRERQTATFVTARQLRQFIEDQKTVNTYRIKGTNYYSSLYEAVLSFIAHLERNRKKEYSLSRYNQFAKRLEREYLRSEKKKRSFDKAYYHVNCLFAHAGVSTDRYTTEQIGEITAIILGKIKNKEFYKLIDFKPLDK